MNQLLECYKRDLRLRGFSEATYKNYLLCIKQFLSYYDQSIDKLDCEAIKDYQFHLLTIKKLSDSKIRQVYSALKYFYTQTLGRSWEDLESGGGLFQLQKFLGHKCLKTTLVYALLPALLKV